jgi:hypothetical protein
VSRIPRAGDWQTLYREAILESDPAKVPEMIDLASTVIRRRAFELWYMGSAAEARERLELDSALYFLELLKKIGPISDSNPEIDAWDKGPSARTFAD